MSNVEACRRYRARHPGRRKKTLQEYYRRNRVRLAAERVALRAAGLCVKCRQPAGLRNGSKTKTWSRCRACYDKETAVIVAKEKAAYDAWVAAGCPEDL